jgi:hypothetical protein
MRAGSRRGTRRRGDPRVWCNQPPGLRVRTQRGRHQLVELHCRDLDVRQPSASITGLHRREDGTMRRRREGLKADPAPPDGWQLCRSDERERPAIRAAGRG